MKARNALAGVRVRAEQARDAAAGQGIHDHHLRGRRVCLGGRQRDALRVAVDLVEGRGERERVAAQLGAAAPARAAIAGISAAVIASADETVSPVIGLLRSKFTVFLLGGQCRHCWIVIGASKGRR